MTDASVNLWGRRIGAVSWDVGRGVGVFQYDPAFLSAGIEVSPMAMPVRETPYAFPALGEAFRGLPGLLADALPDSFGHRLIDVWLAETGRRLEDFSPVDRLCYIGRRGVGALEFEPALRSGNGGGVEIAQLVDLANRVLDERGRLVGRLDSGGDGEALEDILRVGTSAGGARAKAVLAWNPETGEFRSGQVDAEAGFEHWILKFDGVANNRDRELADPLGYGRIEHAYHLMAREAGIEMSECRLHHEGGRSHFMTRRFDRGAKGRKIHMQSLAALRHFDYNLPGAYAYEQAVETIRRLGLGMAVVEEQYRRAVFNIVARNQDDHVKNITFLMNRSGAWRLSPAYDVAYAYNPRGRWTGRHQMSMAGKRDGFERVDLLKFAETSGLKIPAASRVIDRVLTAVGNWRHFASEAGVEERDAGRIAKTHRFDLR
ncbi:MAG: type II toxin-antitoxin system HipA family toxin [Gemmatimonadetes bacterium]|nr:type II toxin-antitoxin system HipA family toxin [Candidatus Palauibacter australiensis]